MTAYETILKRRTIRKYRQRKIERDILVKMINAARLAPSAANMQPLKYIVVDEPGQVAGVFKNVKWAGYIRPAGDPQPGEEPVAFIVILVDLDIKKGDYEMDAGAAAQNIMLTAQEEGIGSCWIGTVNRTEVKRILGIPDKYHINTVIALGYPAEESTVEDEKGSIKYYKDEKGTYHVPKRRLEDILFYNCVTEDS